MRHCCSQYWHSYCLLWHYRWGMWGLNLVWQIAYVWSVFICHACLPFTVWGILWVELLSPLARRVVAAGAQRGNCRAVCPNAVQSTVLTLMVNQIKSVGIAFYSNTGLCGPCLAQPLCFCKFPQAEALMNLPRLTPGLKVRYVSCDCKQHGKHALFSYCICGILALISNIHGFGLFFPSTIWDSNY